MEENHARSLYDWVRTSPLLLPFRPERAPSGLLAHSDDPARFEEFRRHYEALRAKQTRLWRIGLIFEDAVHALLLSSPEVLSVARGLQVLPTGELDFLVTFRDRPERLLHLETAVKYYICVDSAGSPETDRYLGPERRDTLGKKIRKLEDEQLKRLQDHPANRALIPLADDATVESVPFVKGMLFYPWIPAETFDPAALATLAHPREVSPEHARGIWMHASEWDAFLVSAKKAAYPLGNARAYRTEKSEWLATRLTEAAPEIDPAALPISHALSPPLSFALASPGDRIPRLRGFIVPDDWSR